LEKNRKRMEREREQRTRSDEEEMAQKERTLRSWKTQRQNTTEYGIHWVTVSSVGKQGHTDDDDDDDYSNHQKERSSTP
jgi:hypothetical protein